MLNLLSAPTGTVFVGDVAGSSFAVQALGADGVTPIVGQGILFSAAGGTVQFGACGAATCMVMTNASGVASTSVTPLSAGAITLSAASAEGTQVASFNAAALIRSVTAAQAMEYVAAGATFVWIPQVTVADNSAPTAGDLVSWQTVAGPIVFSPGQSQGNAQGIAQTLATIGPLTAGAQAIGSACVWTTVCAALIAQGVDAADLRLQVVSGAGQTVNANGTLSPVVMLVTDTASDPVAGAVVQIYQTVNGWQMACPTQGRCPVAPVYSSSVSSATSDANGLITVTPQQLAGVAEVTNIAAATGTQGFLTLELQKEP